MEQRDPARVQIHPLRGLRRRRHSVKGIPKDWQAHVREVSPDLVAKASLQRHLHERPTVADPLEPRFGHVHWPSRLAEEPPVLLRRLHHANPAPARPERSEQTADCDCLPRRPAGGTGARGAVFLARFPGGELRPQGREGRLRARKHDDPRGFVVQPVQEPRLRRLHSRHASDLRECRNHGGKQRARFPGAKRGGVDARRLVHDDQCLILVQDSEPFTDHGFT